MSVPLDVLALEPWLGGSHERFLHAWQARSRQRVRVLGLPPRHWKWRMQAAAHTLARRAAEGPRPDVVVASDYVDVARLRGFLPAEWGRVPVLCYFHENQLTYPERPMRGPEDVRRDEGSEPDLTYGFTNVLTCLASDRVAFNSAYHQGDFARAAAALLERLPKPAPRAELARALERSVVIPVGVELDAIPLGPGPARGAPLRVAFPHRAEHDKDPVAFLRAARAVEAPLELVLLGESFRDLPEGMTELCHALAERIVHRGYAPDRAEFTRLLGTCDLAVSTARHEFYGLAVLESVAAGCAALAPDGLSYPEVLAGVPDAVLVADEVALTARLAAAARAPDDQRGEGARARRRAAIARHDAEVTARALDDLCDELAGGSGPSDASR